MRAASFTRRQNTYREPVRSWRSAGRRRGATFLEVALSLLPLLALMIGIIDLSMPMFLKSTFTNAVREGVRYGITYQTFSGATHTDSIKTVVQNSALGFLAGTDGLNKIQVKFYTPAGVEVTGAGRNAGGNIVEVSIVGYQWSWIAPLWRTAVPFTVNAVSSDRLEVLPRGMTLPNP